MHAKHLAATPCLPLSEVKGELLSTLPKLRRFAISLCGQTGGRSTRADDLVQQTVMKALAHIHSFTPGTNMTAWLSAILRNEFYSEYRRSRHEVQDEDGSHAAKMQVQPAQEEYLRCQELRDAMDRLPARQREALLLVAVDGVDYERAAAICACAAGTMKSRVNRARAALAFLHADPGETKEVDWPDSPGSGPGSSPGSGNGVARANSAALARRRPPAARAQEATSIRSFS
jgi:RNA polymerase sigma-70 factor (ECF subfamily)